MLDVLARQIIILSSEFHRTVWQMSFHAAAAYAAVMGTWWTRIVTEWLKLPAYLYYVYAYALHQSSASIHFDQ